LHDRRGSENQNNDPQDWIRTASTGLIDSSINDTHQGSPNDLNGMNGILRNSDELVPQNLRSNDVSKEIDKTTTQNKRSNQNNDACHGTPNDSNDLNGILDKLRENSTCNNVPNDKDTITNPKLPPYV